jgi:hypothetical protein
MKSELINELVTALVAAQSEFSAIPKTSDNPFFKSKYAALPDVVLQATPILSKNGLAVMQFVDHDDIGDCLTTYLTHTSGQYISHTMRLHLAKSDPVGQASAITYARRYSYMSAVGLVSDSDDDGNAAQASFQSAPAKASAPTSAPAKAQATAKATLSSKVATAAGKPSGNMASEAMTRMIWAIAHKSLEWDDLQMYETIDIVVGHPTSALSELTFEEAKSVIDHLKSLQEN